MRLHPLTSTFQLIMHPHPVMNKRQQTYFHSLKNYYVLTFGRFSLNTNRGRRSASPLIQTWLIESEVLPCLSYLVMIERVGERDGLSAANSAYYYRRPIASVSHFLSSQPGECIRGSYFLVTIYTYIMSQETRVQSQVDSYQRLKKLYLILPSLTLTIIRYVSREEISLSPTPRCSSN